MDCFSEKLYKDLEDRLTVKNKIIEGIERPNSTMFGDKKDNIKKFVIQCRNRLASSMEEINTLIENNQLMKIMTKRKEYFDLIKDTSTILMKLNALSKSTNKRTENEKVNASEKSNYIILDSNENTKETEHDDSIPIIPQDHDDKTTEFVKNDFGIVTQAPTNNEIDHIGYRKRGRPPMSKVDPFDKYERMIENEKKSSPLEGKEAQQALKMLGYNGHFMLVNYDRKTVEPAGFYIFDLDQHIIKAKADFETNTEYLMSCVYVPEIKRAYFFYKKNPCYYIISEYNVDAEKVTVIYVDKPDRSHWSRMIRCGNKLVLVQINYQIVTIDFTNPSRLEFDNKLPPLTILYDSKIMFNILDVSDMYIYIIDTTPSRKKRTCMPLISQNNNQNGSLTILGISCYTGTSLHLFHMENINNCCSLEKVKRAAKMTQHTHWI